MTYFREVLRRHYEYLEREHAKLSEEEAARTRVEGQNAAYLANLLELMPQLASSQRLWPDGWDITVPDAMH